MLQRHQLESPETQAIIGALPPEASGRLMDGAPDGNTGARRPRRSDQPFKVEEFDPAGRALEGKIGSLA
jgi:hypothetical protein